MDLTSRSGASKEKHIFSDSIWYQEGEGRKGRKKRESSSLTPQFLLSLLAHLFLPSFSFERRRKPVEFLFNSFPSFEVLLSLSPSHNVIDWKEWMQFCLLFGSLILFPLRLPLSLSPPQRLDNFDTSGKGAKTQGKWVVSKEQRPRAKNRFPLFLHHLLPPFHHTLSFSNHLETTSSSVIKERRTSEWSMVVMKTDEDLRGVAFSSCFNSSSLFLLSFRILFILFLVPHDSM